MCSRGVYRGAVHKYVIWDLSKSTYAVHNTGRQQAEITRSRIIVAAVSARTNRRVTQNVVITWRRWPGVLRLACSADS